MVDMKKEKRFKRQERVMVTKATKQPVGHLCQIFGSL